MVRPRRDPGDEHADEGGPGDPPGPVEDGVAAQPRGRRASPSALVATGHRRQLADVGGDRRRDDVEDEHRRADDEHEDREHAAASTMLMLDSHWMPLATPETADRMKQTVSTAMMPTSTPLPTSPRPVTMRRPLPIWIAPRPSDAAEPNSVAKMARMSMTLPTGPLACCAEQRLEGRADELQAALAVDAVRDREAHHRVDRPRVQGPVEQRVRHRALGALRVAEPLGAGRGEALVVGEEGERLVDAVEHEPDAHAGGEHHRDPGGGARTPARRRRGPAGCCRTCRGPATGRRPRSRTR